MLKRVVKWGAVAVLLLAMGTAGVVIAEVRAYDASASKVYAVPLPAVERSTDPAVLERGRHLAESLGACILCHGSNLGGGRDERMEPMAHIVVPNITTGKDGRGNLYSDAELARLIKHGVKRDGTTVRLMPSTDFGWWPDEDVAALISWVRAQPPVDGDPGVTEVSTMGKILDRIDSIPFDVARRIDHQHLPSAPPPAADASYGYFVATACRGCHGATLSGGPLPGAPPDLPVPLNLTPDPTGLGGWTFDDFHRVIETGKRRDGTPLKPLMNVDALRKMNDTELHALWAYLQSVPAKPFGGR